MIYLNRIIADKKGAVLVLSFLVVVTVTIIIISVLPLVVNERQMTKRWTDSVRAFYAAESGANRAIWALNNYRTASAWTAAGWDTTNSVLYTLSLQALSDSGGNIVGYYEIALSNPLTENPTAESVGYCPTVSDVQRSVFITIPRTQAAIIAKGDIDVRGSAVVNPGYLPYADFSFEQMFGQTPAVVKALATTEVIVNPDNNHEFVPSDNSITVTWFELSTSTEIMITNNQSTGAPRTGIIVVEGTKAGDKLKITGGDFDGVIWVIGDLKIAGNATIDGEIFVDGSVEDISEITGNPTINYDSTEITNAFSYNPMPYARGYWREVNQ